MMKLNTSVGYVIYALQYIILNRKKNIDIFKVRITLSTFSLM